MTTLIRHYVTMLKLTFLVSESDSESDSIAADLVLMERGGTLDLLFLVLDDSERCSAGFKSSTGLEF